MRKQVTLLQLQCYIGRTFSPLRCLGEDDFCRMEELHIQRVGYLQNAVALLALLVEPDDFDPIMDLDIGRLGLPDLQGTSTPEKPRPRRQNGQPGRQRKLFGSGLRWLQGDRKLW
jgi:hypothetical protein